MYLLWGDVSEPIDNRSDHRYSEHMTTTAPAPKATTVKVQWLHGDDDTPCEHPHECETLGRFPYVRGGIPEDDAS